MILCHMPKLLHLLRIDTIESKGGAIYPISADMLNDLRSRQPAIVLDHIHQSDLD